MFMGTLSLSLTRNRGLLVELHSKDSFPQAPVRVNAQKAFTKNYEAGDVLDGIWGKVMKLNPVNMEQSQEKWMQRERKTTGKMVGKNDPFKTLGIRKLFILRGFAEATWSLRDLAFLLQGDKGPLCNIGALPISCPLLCCSIGSCSPACSRNFLLASGHGYLQRSTKNRGGR